MAAGAAVPLTAMTASCNDFTVTGGTVTINRCGTYLATYTVNVPLEATIDTDILINVNGVAQPGSLLDIAAGGSYTGQTVFKANPGTTLSIVTTAALSLTESVGQNIVTLTLTRID